MRLTKTIIKMIDNLTENERERARLRQSVEKDITVLNGKKFYKAERLISGKFRTVLLPILDNNDMKSFLSNDLEAIRLASVIVSEYENGNTKPVIKM